MSIYKKTYLDYAATTPVDFEVLKTMQPYFSDYFGNPSSVHSYGQQAEAAVEAARETVAQCLGARGNEIIFTSCGTESDNLALRGVALARRQKTGANRIITTRVEHHAVLHTVEQLREIFGFNIEYLPVDHFGRVDPRDLSRLIGPDAALVSIIYANNEIGTINPMGELGQICRNSGVPFHTDAVQAAAHLRIDVEKEKIDLLSIGAHKFYGPKGVGVLFKREGIDLLPTQTGGGQEFGFRAGTENVPYIVGLAKALELVTGGLEHQHAHLTPLRDKIIGTVLEEIPQSRLTGHPSERSDNHASFVFEHVNGNDLLVFLDAAGFACSSGSACKVGDPKPSDVLEAIGLEPDWSLGSLRITLGKYSTSDDVAGLLKVLPDLVQKARSLN